MSSAMPPRMNIGRTMAIGGAMVGAGLVGFYMNLNRMQKKKEATGTVPHYEHLLAHVGTTTYADPDLVTLRGDRVEARTTLLPAPSKEHNSGHSTIANYKQSPKYSEDGRREQPTPQRARVEGSGVVYTKCPDYVKGYKRAPESKPDTVDVV